MYDFSYFKEQDQQVVLDFIETHPFAFLTGSTLDGKQIATQIPLLVETRDGKTYLQGHIMKNSTYHLIFLENPQVLAVFTGAHCYVSASWYATHNTASTWNYMSVHCHGALRIMTDPEFVRFMKKFTLHFEDGRKNSPTYFDNIEPTFIQTYLPNIVGIEIEVTSLDNVFKLSQNRDEESFMNIITKLEQLGGDSAVIAEEMKKRKEQLFPKL